MSRAGKAEKVQFLLRCLMGTLLLHVTLTTMAATSTAGTSGDDTLRPQLQRIASQRIYFGHQSVGDNLLSGVARLAEQAGVPLQIQKLASDQERGGAEFLESYIAENTQPLKKLQSFEDALAQQRPRMDIAAMKFCFIDFSAQTDAKSLFAQYSARMDRVRREHPGLRIVHITTPLTVVQTGFKASLKRMLGRAPYGLLENQRREEYNRLLRQAYAGKEPVFDLAQLESTLPDGSPLRVEWEGQQVPALVPAYSSDGEHLNALGQLTAARQFIKVLAEASAN